MSNDLTVMALRIIIVSFAIFLVLLALTTKNKWVLAGIAAWEILP